MAASRQPGSARAGEALHWQFVLHDIPAIILRRHRGMKLTVPTVILAGAEDWMLPPKMLAGAGRHDLEELDEQAAGALLGVPAVNQDWPMAELDPVRRMRVIAAATPAWHTRKLIPAPFSTDLRSFEITSTWGERMTARARGRLGQHARLCDALRVKQRLDRGSCSVGVQASTHDSLHDSPVEDDDQLIGQSLRVLGACSLGLAGEVAA